MTIKPNDLTIFMLFNTQNEQFLIPPYQRRYAWGDPQVLALFEDLDMLPEGDGHLLGMIILHTGIHHGGLNTIELVDGQQRITTISLLLFALLKKFERLNRMDKVQEVKRMLYCSTPSGEEKPKLVLGELDQSDYEKLLQGNLEDVQNKKLSNAFSKFSQWISDAVEQDEKWINSFYYKLVNVAKIIRLDVGLAKDAYKLFETINNRGLKLSATDILKNFILGHAAKMSQGKLDLVKAKWAKIITTLDGIPTDIFFRQFMCGILTRKISQTKLVEEFKKHYMNNVENVSLINEYAYYGYDEEENDLDEIENSSNNEKDDEETQVETPSSRVDLLDYLEPIQKAAECYRKIWLKTFADKKINQSLSNLDAIQSFPTYIFLMFFLQKESPKGASLAVLKMLESFMLRRHICKERTSQNDDIFSNLLRVKSDSDYISSIKNALSEFFPDDIDFLDSFPKHDFDGRQINRAKYILTEIEYFKTNNKGEYIVNSGRDVQLEHIIPEKITPRNWRDKFGDWVTYLGDKSDVKHKKFVGKLGNMTILLGELNLKISNSPFGRKKPSYKESTFQLNKELSQYSDFKFSHVEKRGKELAELAVKIWTL